MAVPKFALNSTVLNSFADCHSIYNLHIIILSQPTDNNFAVILRPFPYFLNNEILHYDKSWMCSRLLSSVLIAVTNIMAAQHDIFLN